MTQEGRNLFNCRQWHDHAVLCGKVDTRVDLLRAYTCVVCDVVQTGLVCAHAVDMYSWLAFVAPDLIAAVVCLAAGELAAEKIVVYSLKRLWI